MKTRLTIPEFAPTEARGIPRAVEIPISRLTIPEFAPTEASHNDVLQSARFTASRFLNSRRLKLPVLAVRWPEGMPRLTIPEFAPTEARNRSDGNGRDWAPPHDS